MKTKPGKKRSGILRRDAHTRAAPSPSGGGKASFCQSTKSFCCILLSIFFLTILLPSSSPAATLYVSESVPGEYRLIQDALDAAVAGDEVVVRDGKYNEANLDCRGKAITLRSEHGPDYTIINGSGDRAIGFFNGEGPGTVVSGFKIKTYVSPSRGYVTGIVCYYSSPTITNCTIGGEGGLFPHSGGGFALIHSSPIITECEIRWNGANAGGGINAHDSSPTITHCKIHGNWAYWGGGIFLEAGCRPTISNCAIYRNHSDGAGGGIFCKNSSPIIINCTIAKNRANAPPPAGAALHCDWDSSPNVCNSILWGNNDPGLPEVSGREVLITYSDIEGGYAGEGNIDQDPLFVAPALGNFELSDGSPAIDAGTLIVDPPLPATDLAGNPRIINGKVDMGAYEHLSALAAGPGPIEDLVSCVDALALPRALANSYLAHLKKVEAFISVEQITPAINQLEAFIGKLRSDIEKGNISSVCGEPIIEMAETLVEMLQ